MTSEGPDDDDVIKNFYQFLKIFTHSMSLPGSIIIRFEVFLGWQKAQSKYV